MGEELGTPFVAQVRSSDASAGVSVPIYLNGSTTAYTLKSNEYVEIHTALAVVAAAGELHVFTSASSTPGSAGTVVRGTVPATGGLAVELCPPHAGQPGHTVWLVAAAGNADAVVRGSIRIWGSVPGQRHKPWQA